MSRLRSEMPTRRFDAKDKSWWFWLLLLAVSSGFSGIALSPDIDHVNAEDGEESAPVETVANRVLDEGKASSFMENRGQIHNPDVRYYIVSRDLQVGFADSSVLLKFVEPAPSSMGDEHHPMTPTAQLLESGHLRGVMLRLRFEGANDVSPQARVPRPHLSQFFLGSDAAQWWTGVRNYGEVVYEDLYAGVDLIYRATPAGVKYEFHLQAGADPELITLVYDGADGVELDGAGNARIQSSVGILADSAPIASQGADQVPCAFVPRGPRSYGVLCQRVDGSRPLVIDPLLTATFLGGGGIEGGNAIAVDMDGNAYMTGATESVDFPPSPGAFNQNLSGRVDAFVAKLDPTLSFCIYMTYLGGVGEDRGLSIAVGAGGSVYVTGTTDSGDFPTTPGAYDTTHNGGWDAFVTKLNATGSGLLYATYLGGSGEDRSHSVAAGPGGSVFLTGNTFSADFPSTPLANDTVLGGASDAFVAKLDVTGGSLDYATYLGGAGNESGLSIAIDSGGNAYSTGKVDSAGFPATAGTIQETFGGGPWDAFVVKVNPAGTSLVYATFLGGSGNDDGSGIAVDGAGNAYVTGSTVDDVADLSTTVGANDTTHNGNTDAFVAKVNPTGTALLYGTFLGGAAHDYGYGIAVDGAGNVYVAGRTNSAAFPTTPDAISTVKKGAHDGFVTRLNPGSVALSYSTYLGGLNFDFAGSIALDSAGNAYATGETDSPNFPVTPGAWDADLDTSSSNPLNWTDAFVAKFVWPSDLSVLPADIAFVPPGPAIAGTVVTINATVRNLGAGDASQVWVRFHDGPPSGTNEIGTYQLIPLITALGGAGNVTVGWTAWPPGSHDVCVAVDPSDFIAETNETNNVACAQVLVTSAPEPWADYVPDAPQPLLPLRAGLFRPVSFSVQVRNQGDATANATSTLAFFNGTAPGSPFATFSLPLLQPEEVSARFVATWMSPAAPGTYDVSAKVDSGNSLLERDETNNVFVWQVDVVTGPVTSFLLGTPNVTAAQPFATSATELSFNVLDQSASGIRSTWYGVDGRAWTNYSADGPFRLLGEGPHLVAWYSEDFLGNVEAIQSAVVIVDDAPPITTPSVGDLKYLSGGTFMTSSTPVSLTAEDPGVDAVGVTSTEYRIDAESWIPFAAPFTVSGEGAHDVGFRSTDRLGNAEVASILTVVVDDSPPMVSLSIGDPQYAGAQLYVRSTSPLAIVASDGGVLPVGLSSVEYRIGNGMWVLYGNPFTVSPPDGATHVEYAATDHLGHRTADARDLVLDDTSPSTTISPATGTHRPDTVFTLSATDGGAGVALTEVWIDENGWRPYTGGFALPEGDHVVRYRSADRLNNTETEHVVPLTIVAPVPLQVGVVLLWILLLGIITVGAVLGLNESLRVSFLTPFVILWARLSRSDILDNKKRGMVVGYLAANPAANFAAIRADLNMAMGTLTYHLWVLEKEGEIKSWRDGRLRRYAPRGHRVAEMQPRLTDIELVLLQRIRGTSGLTQKELAKDVGVSQPAVSYHISRMAALGFLLVEKRGRRKRYSANLGDAPGKMGSQADLGGVIGSEPPDETDDWGASR